jgi:hypothetical protein
MVGGIYDTMTCGGSHFGFPIGIKNRGPSNDLGKMFQNASSLKPLGQLKPNCPGMIIGRSSVFYADRKSKMAATTGHSIIDATNHYDFSVIVTNFGPKLRCYGQQSTCYGFPIYCRPGTVPHLNIIVII